MNTHLTFLHVLRAIVILMASFTAAVADTQTKFYATLSSDQLDNPVAGTVASGNAEFLLTEPDAPGGAVTLSYNIVLNGLDLDSDNHDGNDVWGIHLHLAPTGSTGPHALNIYGLPRQDDAEMTSDPARHTLQGVWDDDDENLLPMNPLLPIGPGNIHMSSSRALSDMLDALKSEQILLAVHSWGQAGEPVIGGRLLVVPEPGSCAMIAAAFLFLGRRRA